MTPAYLVFHLNMAFSSIAEDKRGEVIRKCYHPMLDLAEERGIPLGVELTGWTLAEIRDRDSGWVERFRRLLDEEKVELIGSGWTQSIGPLLPAAANRRNQQLGLRAYREMLDRTPSIALVNEMAFSTSMVDLYAEAGYRGILLDRDNVRLALSLEHTPLSTTPTHARGFNSELPVLWSDSMLFQRFQRVVHRDIPVDEYLSYVSERAETDGTALPIYCNDAETFDYRPGRFDAESDLHGEGEWERMRNICSRLEEDCGLQWLAPSQALERTLDDVPRQSRRLSSVIHPIPVKKKTKYNVSRWAVTGRDDLWLNTACHCLCRHLEETEAGEEAWRELCELWASDYRTHITGDRWEKMRRRLDDCFERHGLVLPGERKVGTGWPAGEGEARPLEMEGGEARTLGEGVEARLDEEEIYLDLETPGVRLRLNLRRGLTLYTLAFRSHDFRPLAGTLPQGYFNNIERGADYYLGNTIIELPVARKRLTDLQWVRPRFLLDEERLVVTAEIPLSHGTIRKHITIQRKEESLQMGYSFPDWDPSLYVIRTGTITLNPEFYDSELQISCHNGGDAMESFDIDSNCDHTRAGSTLVSCNSGFGATCGEVRFGDRRKGLEIRWDPSRCAAMPMLYHAEAGSGRSLTRLYFSLRELDESSHKGGHLPDFELGLRPYSRNAE